MKYNKILLTQPPTSKGSSKNSFHQPALGLANLAAVIEDKIDVLPIFDGNFSNSYIEELQSIVKSERPDIVGFTAYTSFVSEVMKGARIIKEIDHDALVIIGGPHSTVLPEKTLMRCPDIDVAVIGEGEKVIQEIIQGISFDEISGIAYRTGGSIIKTKQRDYIKDLDSLPYPAYHLLPNFPDGYKNHPPKVGRGPWTSVIWSRGCPFNCIYCTREASFGRIFRSNSPKYVVGLLKYLHDKYGIEEVTFYDDVFTLNRSKTMELLKFLYPENLGFKLSWDCETRVDLVNQEMLQSMHRAGCHTIAYGIEHGLWINQIKGGRATNEQAEKAIRWTHEAGINTIGYFMIGLPNETVDTIRSTINFAKKLDVTWAQFAITIPLPGSELYRKAVSINPNFDNEWDKLVYESLSSMDIPNLFSKDLSESDLVCWRRKAYKEFYLQPSYILKRLFSIRDLKDLRMYYNGLKMLINFV
jgi:radical SAM superfamily enzyme YgiQ (UPF0313 family)